MALGALGLLAAAGCGEAPSYLSNPVVFCDGTIFSISGVAAIPPPARAVFLQPETTFAFAPAIYCGGWAGYTDGFYAECTHDDVEEPDHLEFSIDYFVEGEVPDIQIELEGLVYYALVPVSYEVLETKTARCE